jgi:hypothetical protein
MLLLVGCGDDIERNSSPTKIRPSLSEMSGHFIDSGVEGITYSRSNGGTYTTQEGGRFNYYLSERITFSVGNLKIGTAMGLSTITPKDIVSYEDLTFSVSIEDPQVNNRTRTLMSLDEDGIAANGIQISPETLTKAAEWRTPDYSLNESAFTEELNSVTNNELASIVSKDEAVAHLATSLRCVYSGAYSGTWLFPDGTKDGFVGVMIQSDGTIVTLGDGQDLNNDGDPSEFLFARGSHNADTGYFDFNETGEFKDGGIVPSDRDVSGDGSSTGYDRVLGSFKQLNPATGLVEEGSYEANRVGEGNDVSYRYTGYGYDNPSDNENPQTDKILGLFTFDINRDGSIFGLIHDARNNEEPSLVGQIDFNTGNVDIDLTYDDNSSYKIIGHMEIDGTVNLDWYDKTETQKYGYIAGVGCQLQVHKQ